MRVDAVWVWSACVCSGAAVGIVGEAVGLDRRSEWCAFLDSWVEPCKMRTAGFATTQIIRLIGSTTFVTIESNRNDVISIARWDWAVERVWEWRITSAECVHDHNGTLRVTMQNNWSLWASLGIVDKNFMQCTDTVVDLWNEQVVCLIDGVVARVVD